MRCNKLKLLKVRFLRPVAGYWIIYQRRNECIT
jgi:hypothetical protein